MSKINRRQLLKSGALMASAAALPLQAKSTLRSDLTFDAYRRLDAMALAELVSSGEASPAELLDIAIARSQAVNPTVNAVVLEHFEQARAAVARDLPQGPLRGVPFLLKDLGLALSGTVTTHGSRLFKDNRLDYDSTLVQRYKRAGLVIFGKTHSPEFGGSPSSESALFGQTHNPWNLAHSAGGSSGGAAAAVAAGIVPAANASDGGGSIRIPASACGLFGMKPSRGRIPLGPDGYESRNGCSTIHAVSRSVRDNALLMDISQGGDLGDPYGSPQQKQHYSAEITREPGRLKIALMTEPLIPVPVDKECIKATERAAKLCESLGHHIEIASPRVAVESVYLALGLSTKVHVAEKVSAREKLLGRAAKEDELEAITRIDLQAGRQAMALDYAQARQAMHAASRALAGFMRGYDVILSPTMAMTPPKLGKLHLAQSPTDFYQLAGRASAFTSLYNITGQPAMSVPLHWTREGLPVGVMFAGRFGDEATLYRLAAQLEQAQPWFDRMAPI